MTKAQIKVFEDLLASNDFSGKKQLRYLLWRNTSKPKFKVGQCVTVTDYSHRVFGHQVIQFRAKITGISSFIGECEWHYEMEMDVTCGDRHSVVKQYAMESKLTGGVRNNKNVLGEARSKHEEQIDIAI